MKKGILERLKEGPVLGDGGYLLELEKRGWVRREACPGDGRYVNAVLTDEGWVKVVATAPGHVAAVRRLVVDALSPEDLAALGSASGHVLGEIDKAPE